MKTKGNHGRFKCRIGVNNYEYATNLTCFQSGLQLAFSIGFLLVEGFNSKKPKIEIFHLQNVAIFISTSLLLNAIRFGFILICNKSRIEKCRCRLPGKGWILGVY